MCVRKAAAYRRERNAAYDKKRAASPHRKLYQTEAWRQLRALRLKVSPRCAMCGGVASVVDHVERHNGDRAKFFSFSNTQSLCKSPCHDSRKQSMERLGYDTTLGADGYPVSKSHPFYKGTE